MPTKTSVVGIAGRDSGFSLVEVLVTVAIIALLTAVALPQYIAYRAQAVDAQMKDDLKSAALAMESYFSDKKIYPTSVAEIVGTGFNQTQGVALTIDLTSPSTYTLTAAKPSGSQASFSYDSSTGAIN
jgi:prepilin-type N-terminal cleavage/methylation domain-containing protein